MGLGAYLIGYVPFLSFIRKIAQPEVVCLLFHIHLVYNVTRGKKMLESINIQQIIYEAFLDVLNKEEQLRRVRAYGKTLDKFYETLTEEQQKLFDKVLELQWDEEYNIEQKLIQFVLEFVHSLH